MTCALQPCCTWVRLGFGHGHGFGSCVAVAIHQQHTQCELTHYCTRSGSGRLLDALGCWPLPRGGADDGVYDCTPTAWRFTTILDAPLVVLVLSSVPTYLF